jgi:hypothetical protein
MMRLTKGILWIGLLLVTTCSTWAFSLLGPFKNDANGFVDPWQGAGYGGQPQGLGYELAGDLGGPMFTIEGYRWNIPVVTYAFDFSFYRYFGQDGINAVEQAIGMLNALPRASRMSESLAEYSLDTKSENATAASLGLLDLKSLTLSMLLEQLGLASPERFVWGLRGRVEGNGFTNYTTIQMNYDPVTIQPSRYVNGVLYNYQIFDDLGPVGGEWASAVEWYQLDPLYQPYSSVASGFGTGDFELGDQPSTVASVFSGLQGGQYFSGLTRDDVGAIRFLLSPNNMVFETLLPTIAPAFGGGSPWTPFIGGTNITGVSNVVGGIATNFTNFVQTALRPGVDKINFRRVSLIGTNFSPITIRYTDRYIDLQTGRRISQPVERLVLQPDIIFAVTDLGTVQEVPVRVRRTDTTGWTNNAALNTFLGGAGLGGPGVITPGAVIAFSDIARYFLNLAPGDGDFDHIPALVWGSFDGTDSPPIVYPQTPQPNQTPAMSLRDLRNYFLGRNP